MELPEQLRGKDAGQAPLHQQIADPVEQGRGIVHRGEPLFEVFEFLLIAAAAEGINQGFFCWHGCQWSRHHARSDAHLPHC